MYHTECYRKYETNVSKVVYYYLPTWVTTVVVHLPTINPLLPLNISYLVLLSLSPSPRFINFLNAQVLSPESTGMDKPRDLFQSFSFRCLMSP